LNNIELPLIHKRLIAEIYVYSLKSGPVASNILAERTLIPLGQVEGLLQQLTEIGLAEKVDGSFILTKKGRSSIIVVMAGGAFEIIHPGHIYTLSACKKLGDVLIVSVARNKTFLESKGRDPVNDEKDRAMLVGSLRSVDAVILGSERDIFETVEKVRPDIIVLGYDQKHDERVILEECRKRGVNVKVIRLDSPIPTVKTSKIIKDLEVLKEF